MSGGPPVPGDDRPAPAISVVIATRNHGDRIRATLESLQGCRDVAHEVIVVDQSEDDQTGKVVRALAGAMPVRHVPTRTVGVSAGRNLGLEHARSEIVAVTDDDCRVPPDWLSETLAAFDTGPRIAVVCGNVVPAPHDRAQGFIVGYERRAPFLARGIRDKHRVEGTSACMAIRRSAWRTLGGFDEMMGVGAPLRAAGETDFFVRALLAGYHVYETPRVAVVNTSFFPWERGQDVIHRYCSGNGALLAKHLRCGHWSVLGVYVRMMGRLGWATRAVYTGTRDHRGRRVWWFLEGFVKGLRTPVDRARCLFVPAAGQARRARRRMALLRALIRARALVLAPWVRGDRFACPLCGGRFGRMLPFGREPVTGERVIGAGRRPHARCPGCNALDRERLAYLFLRDRTTILAPGPPLRLLHVAPEPSLGGVLSAHPRLAYLSADLQSPLAMERMDLTAIRHPDAAFDVIVCCHVLQSVGDDRAAMRELFRVLRPGGHALLQVSIAPDRAQTLERPTPGTGLAAWAWDQARLYGRDYADRLAAAGFVVDARRCADAFDEATVRRFALIPDETVFWCGRPAA